MPRLLAINNFHYRRAGSDGVFLDHNRLFASRGWDVAVFSMHHPSNDITPWQEFFVEQLDYARDYPLHKKLRLAGKVLYSTEAIHQLKRLLLRFTPDVVHVHSIYHHISPAILPVLKRTGAPIVLTAHDYKLACPAYKMFDGTRVCEECRDGGVLPLIRKRCIHDSFLTSSLVALEAMFERSQNYYDDCVDRIVCPSNFLLEKFVEWQWPRERLVQVSNFFDPKVWTPRFEPGGYFLYFGRLAPEKGVATLLRACALARVPLKIVGAGDLQSSLVELAKSLQSAVEFIDHLPTDRLATIVANARAVVVPSEWYENASLATLESFACGKPVIASRMGGNPELIAEGLNGWLFDAGNVQVLAERLNQVWNMPEPEVEAIGRAAHAWVTGRYNADLYYESMNRLYTQLGVGTMACSA